MRAPFRTPTATYRLQLRREFALEDARAAIPYLRLLGISDLYLSPLYTARPGSIHGYDVVAHGLNPELGDETTLGDFLDSAAAAGLGVVLDVVPNHMCVSTDANVQWMDVLEDGRQAASALQFDIDWEPPKPELVGKVLLPFLGEQYGHVLEGGLKLGFDQGRFFVTSDEQKLPLACHSWHHILAPTLSKLRAQLPPEDVSTIELESILRALAQLPPQGPDANQPVAYRHEKEAIRLRLATLAESSGTMAKALVETLATMNGIRDDPASFDPLESLMDDQHYRLAHWQVAAHEINYRRFFDINELAAIRVEEPEVFARVHALPFQIATHPAFTGFRIDHVDGLSDPEQYLLDLQRGWADKDAATPPAGAAKPAPGERPFVVVEKILGVQETLSPGWLADGTTGYDFIPILAGILTSGQHAAQLKATASGFGSPSSSFDQIAYESKRVVLQTTLAAELTVLARALDRISEQHRYTRDFTLNHLQTVLGETIACFPVYRSYIRRDDPVVLERDARVVGRAIMAARRRNPLINASLFDFLESVLLRRDPPGLCPEQTDDRREFVTRFQQLTGPAVAKGVEDTAFYRYLPLVALNEVGGDPERLGTPLSSLHQALRARQQTSPRTLSGTATHDTKRGEDTRARLYVLGEVAEEWVAAVTEWTQLTASLKTEVDGAPAPDASEEYLLYQTLVGAWPLEGPQSEPDFAGRIQAYMVKARHEAKAQTSWINPHPAYDAAADRFVAGAMDYERSHDFLSQVDAFARRIIRPGLWNSLAQVVLKMAAPGIPDLFQGTELWDFSLDFDRSGQLEKAKEGEKVAMLRTLHYWGLPPIVLLTGASGLVFWRVARRAHA